MRYLVSKPGVQVSRVYAKVNGNGVFWIISAKKATEFSLVKARKFARAHHGEVTEIGS